VFSQFLPDGGPIPTKFNFDESANYKLAGKAEEKGKAVTEFSKEFNLELKYYEREVAFKQKINVFSKSDFIIVGTIDYETCKEECIFPPAQEFTFKVKGNPQGKDAMSAVTEKHDTLAAVIPTDTLKEQPAVTTTVNSSGARKSMKEMVDALEPGCGEKRSAETDKSFLGIFVAGMLGGFLALLTPCVFPMIPLTVSFFTKRSKTRKKGIVNAVVYAVSIIVIYVLLGLLITISFGPDALNDMATNVYFNMLFFIIFLVFALSFFGAFEITLPSSWVNKADAASEKGGLAGIFFMAFTLSLVSFSCTGPIIGTLLVEAAQGRSYIGPLAGMAGVSFALSLPFALFAMFPAWLHSLPKSGGWLNSVKVVLGFVELALALKFLSTVDQAYHWYILPREIFISLWIIIFGLMGLYLLGKIKFNHDSELKHLSVSRLLFAIVTLSFTLYLIPGLWGAPLKLISGFPPPLFYKEWKTKGETHDCPHDLNCFHDYDEGMAYARKQGKPVMIDFTGWGCQNCRRMEENVWIDPEVFKRISEKYVLISLYVDDKTPLPDDQRISPFSGNKIKTVGNKWSDFQTKVYEKNSQPTYVLVDNHGNLLAEPVGYTPKVSDYIKFLEEGLCRYDIRKVSEVAAN
jgi:thiol:disulfide interchange protein DsbD